MITHGKVTFTAACFGKPHDWSLNPFQEPGDQSKDWRLAERLGQALSSVGATTVFATRPVHANARIIDRHRLNKHIALPHGVDLVRNGDIPADGTSLYPGEASAMTAGGCPRIVVVCGSAMADAHAGRDSLIDRERVLTGMKSRRHETVVEALLERVSLESMRKDVHAWVFFSIEARRFVHDGGHDTYGTYNCKLPNHIADHWGMPARIDCVSADDWPYPYQNSSMYLDLPRLIRAQFASLGVPSNQVHLEYAYGSSDLLFDTRGPDAKKRNLVTVVRHT